MAAHPFDLTGKIALVTGAYRGLGFAIAQGLAQAGATVVLNGRRPAELAAAAKKLIDAGHRATTHVFDVTDAAAIRTAVAAIEALHGRLDILVNNAGIQRRNPLVDFTPGGLGRGHRHQPDRAVPRLAGGAAGNDRAQAAARSSTSRR